MESWCPIAGFEGIYEVSDHGRVRSLPHQVPYGTKGAMISKPGSILKPWWVSNQGNRQGTLVISLGRGNRFRVSHLVLEAFVGARPEGCLARHLDDDKSNNNVSNLAWGTYSENAHDAVRNRKHGMTIKTHCPKNHPLDGMYGNGKRYCKTCKRARSRDYGARKRAGEPMRRPGRPRAS